MHTNIESSVQQSGAKLKYNIRVLVRSYFQRKKQAWCKTFVCVCLSELYAKHNIKKEWSGP